MARHMTRRRRRRLIAVVVVLPPLLLAGVWAASLRATRASTRGLAPLSAVVLTPPEYLYSFDGDETGRLSRPIGVLVADDEVLVADARLGEIFRFDVDGDLLGTFGRGTVMVPLYLARSPVDGNVYVSDRGLGTIHVFTPEGRSVGEFEPDLPESRSPALETPPRWAPVALAFGPDGTLYVTEMLGEHRLLVFDPEGGFVRAVGGGDAGADGDDLSFQFPAGIEVVGEEVWVADSNNRRIQVFDLEGGFLRVLPLTYLPRGLAVVPTVGDEAAGTGGLSRVAVVDTLAHEVSIRESEGDKSVTFGGQGVAEGRFAFPSDVSVGPDGLVFVTDTANSRVQAWGWRRGLVRAFLRSIPWLWAVSLVPLLLASVLLVRHKRRFFATEDFVRAMLAAGLVHEMPHARRTWIVLPSDYDSLEEESEGDIRLGDLLESTEYSESDARRMRERLEVDADTAACLALAERARVVCTQDERIRRLAKGLEMDVVDRDGYMERFAPTGAAGGEEG